MTTEQETPKEHFALVKERARQMVARGINVIPLLPKGARYPQYNKETMSVSIEVAKGNSAKGLPPWGDQMKKKQKPEYIDTFDKTLKWANDRIHQYEPNTQITTLGLGLVCGNVSGDRGYGLMVLEIDGEKGREIWENALTSLRKTNPDIADKLEQTPLTQSPSGGWHFLVMYRKKDFKKKQLRADKLFTGINDHEEIEILANGNYVTEPPTEGYVPIREDWNKVAHFTKAELDRIVECIKNLSPRQPKGEEKNSWMDNAYNELQSKAYENDDKVYSQPQNVAPLVELVRIENLYQEPHRHSFTLKFGSYMRRYIKMNKQDIHEVIEQIHPHDKNNWDTVEDIFKKPLNEIANRETLRKCILDITKDEKRTDKIMQELSSYETKPSRVKRTIGAERSIGDDDDEPEDAELLMLLAERETELCFKDLDGNFYAMVQTATKNGYEILELGSEEFELKLGVWYTNETGELTKKEWKQQVIDLLKGTVNEFARKETLYNRMVWLGDAYYYNLNNEKGEIVKVTKDEITILKQSPDLILFKKLPEDHEQVTPDFNLEKDKDYLKEFLNWYEFEDNDDGKHTLVLESYIATLFLDAAASPIHAGTGDEGATKTTLLRMIKSLLDSTENKNGKKIEDKILSLTTALDIDPNHTWERFLTIHQNHFTCFDNIDHIPRNIFDELCIAVTGYKVPKRVLYKTDKLMYLIGRRPLALTSVVFTAPKPDYLDRVLHSKLLAAKQRKTEDQVWREFYELKPKLLGYIFTKIQEFLGKYYQLKDTIKPMTRLADFEIQAEIMSRCLGNAAGDFQNAWVNKKSEQIQDSLEKHSLYIMLVRYLKRHRNGVKKSLGNRKMMPSDYKIKDCQTMDHYSAIGIDTTYGKMFIGDDDKWVKSANLFGLEINKLRGQLRNVGIVITDERNRKKNKNYKVIDYSKWAEGRDDEFWKIDSDETTAF